MKNLAELKRNAQKYTFEMFYHHWEGGILPDNHKFKNFKRKVKILQTNAIMFEGNSWLYFTKAKDFKFTDGESLIVMTVALNTDGTEVMKYKLRLI